MFNSTHTLVGLAIARTGAGRWAKYGTATAVIAANLPDIDIVTSFWGTAAYLDHHRGITHSLVGIPFLALLLTFAMYFFSGNFGKTYAIALIAMATHPALDFLNSYGYRPFLPWSGKWYYGDLLFIIDPYIDVALLVGILLGWKWPEWKRAGAFISLGLATLYIGAKLQLHSTAVGWVQNQSFGQIADKWAVLPQVNPLMWDVIAQSKNESIRLPIRVLPHPASSDDVAPSIKSDPPSEITERAAEARSAAVLLSFARFPITKMQRLPSGYRVTFIDFSFYRETTNTALAADVTLDQSLRVVSEDLGFVRTVDISY
jgi:inner membrane protein